MSDQDTCSDESTEQAEPLVLVGDLMKDSYAVLLAVIDHTMHPLQAICVYAGKYGFEALVNSIPYWLGASFGRFGEQAAKAGGPVDLGFRGPADAEHVDYVADDAPPAMVWAGQMALAWCNGDKNMIQALMKLEFTPIMCLTVAEATLYGLRDNFDRIPEP